MWDGINFLLFEESRKPNKTENLKLASELFVVIGHLVISTKKNAIFHFLQRILLPYIDSFKIVFLALIIAFRV